MSITSDHTLYLPDIGPPADGAIIADADLEFANGLAVRATNWLGDTLMSLPALFKLKERLPTGVPLSVVCRERLAPLWKSVPWVDDILPFHGHRLGTRLKDRLRNQDPELAVVLPNSFGSVWDLWSAGIRCIVGRTGRVRSPMLRWRLPAWRRRPGKDQYHEARKYLEIATACGARGWDCHYPPLVADPAAREECGVHESILDDERLLVIAPGAAYGPAKRWPADHFRQITHWWSTGKGPVVAVGGNGEEASGAEAVAGCERAINIVGKTSLPQLMYILSRATAVVANDSGSMHLAAALGKRGVALFGSTDPIATGPVGAPWFILHHALPCSPCLSRTCPRTDIPYECLTTITPAAVMDALCALTES